MASVRFVPPIHIPECPHLGAQRTPHILSLSHTHTKHTKNKPLQVNKSTQTAHFSSTHFHLIFALRCWREPSGTFPGHMRCFANISTHWKRPIRLLMRSIQEAEKTFLCHFDEDFQRELKRKEKSLLLSTDRRSVEKGPVAL